MINLFEYQNIAKLEDPYSELDEFLDIIWKKREISTYYDEKNKPKTENQKFINFLYKTKEIKSNKYVGIIHFAGKKINLLPKIFYEPNKSYSELKVAQIQKHILWWLSYCRKLKFPNYQSSLSNMESDFFEILIYLFSKYTKELLNSSIYQQYEEINEELTFIKGQLNTHEYIRQNLGTGRWHKVNCKYDSFVMDNEFNRIIKNVTTILFNYTKSQDNKKNLREILFILDNVSDMRATAKQCKNINFNYMYKEFEIVRDYCYLFLSNCISFDYKDDLKLFAFLLPMEYVFEDFIYGFIEKEIEDIKVKSQRSDIHLDEDKLFKLKPDLFFQINNKSIIADTKYKLTYSNEVDPKKSISQNDLYQMVSYSIKFNINEILLFYPNTIINTQDKETKIIIKDYLADGKEINIKAFQLPIINIGLINSSLVENSSLEELFEPTKLELIKKLKQILLLTI